jgi:microcystin degradation protein MlrC
MTGTGNRRRIAVARLWLEVNVFSPVPTDISDFRTYEWDWGGEALRRARGTATEMGAVAAFASRPGSPEIVVLRSAAAVPGGPMSEEVLQAFLAEVESGLAKGGNWDGVYLSLHGASVTQANPSVEASIVRMVRQAVGPRTPIAASFDMHGNLPESMFGKGGIDIAVGYKTYPHVDMNATADKALTLLCRAIEGSIEPVTVCRQVGAILHSFNMRTTDGPMRDIVAFARSLERAPILDVSAFGGFPFADSPHTGASVVVTTDGEGSAASQVAVRVARYMAEQAPRFCVAPPGPEHELEQAANGTRSGLTAILECADNTYTGGIADVPALFSALLSVKPVVPSVFAYFWDPELVSRAHQAGVGSKMHVKLGGRITEEYGPGVRAEAEVVRLTDGRFANEGPLEHGRLIEMGASAVLLVDGVKVIVTSTRQPVNDIGYFRLHDVDLSCIRLLCVKAKNHFRASLAPFCANIVEVDTPGPAQVDLRRFPYQHVPPHLIEACVGSRNEAQRECP